MRFDFALPAKSKRGKGPRTKKAKARRLMIQERQKRLESPRATNMKAERRDTN